MTGTLVTKHHLETWPGKSVIVLEAREFCSGATGRNAGHCKPGQWRHFARFEQAYGKEQAIKILDNENETWKDLVSYVREHDVDCDLWVGDTFDIPLDDEVAKIEKAVFERYQDAGGNTGHIKVTHNPFEAAKISRVKSAKACYAWPASTLQPWKLTAHIMRSNLECGANLQTNTIAQWVSAGPMGGRNWVIHTDRGDIACNTVVYATNAYSAAIEPSLTGIITPKPHICNMVIPPRSLCGSKAIQHSSNVLLPNGAVYSINPRSSSDGAMMFGGSNPGQKQFDEWVERHPENCINDGFARLENITKYVQDFVEKELEGWNDAKMGPGEGFEYSWSGIEGISVDGVPFVGEIPGKPGQWVCAGYQGQ
jgi:glycine/D-amino acid oxidase-like deaminating enzyme